jgi:hypothetical protein
METINTVCVILKLLLFDLSYKWYSRFFIWLVRKTINERPLFYNGFEW